MDNKQKLIELFENNRDKYISGEEIAETLSISRAGVWKAVQSLRKAGYQIDAVTNRGYRLNDKSDVLSAQGIKRFLCKKDLSLEYYPEVESTNTLAKCFASEGAGEGKCVVASSQTKGKGRMGRAFYSPEGTGVYISVVLRPTLSAEKSTLITTAAAVAVCRAIEVLSNKKPQIKWVNDVFVDGKKVCGILTEASFSMESGRLDYAVLGVGVNIYKPKNGFPDDIEKIAGSVFSSVQADIKNRFCAEFLNAFFELYEKIEQKEFLNEYKKRCFCIGKKITVISSANKKNAKALDIDDNFHLVVEFSDGSKKTLSSGEISIRVE